MTAKIFTTQNTIKVSFFSFGICLIIQNIIKQNRKKRINSPRLIPKYPTNNFAILLTSYWLPTLSIKYLVDTTSAKLTATITDKIFHLFFSKNLSFFLLKEISITTPANRIPKIQCMLKNDESIISNTAEKRLIKINL